MRIGIVGGTGKMGKWFETFFKRQGLEVFVWDRSLPFGSKEIIGGLDVVLVSVPLSVAEKVIRRVGPHLKDEALFMDLCSVKVLPVRWMLEASHAEVVGAHPLFGPQSKVLDGLTICLCPVRAPRWLEEIKKVFERGGLRVVLSTPEEHDKAMAIVQAVHHFSNLALGSLVLKAGVDLLSPFFTVGFRKRMELLRGVVEDDPDMYRQMVLMNPWAKEALWRFVKEFEETVGFIGKKGGFEALFFELKKGLFPRRRLRLVYLGPEGTFSHLAALEVGTDWELVPVSSLKEVFGLVERGEADYGIVPVENSLEGMVNETHDLLFENSLEVVAEISLKISYVLANASGDPKMVKRIYSHWQALGQCRDWLRTNYPQAELIGVDSTARAALLALEDVESSALLSPRAARLYGLKVLFGPAEEIGENITRFFLIGKAPLEKPISPKKASLCFLVPHIPGALYKALEPFAKKGINLTRIVSRPKKGSKWEYVFFVDLEIPPERERLQEALEELKERTVLVKSLGKYELLP